MIRSLLFQLEPETAHQLTLNALKIIYRPWLAKLLREKFPQKPVNVFDLEFPNPVGLAAGLDKDAEYIDGLLGLGFGFIELGAVTPHPQPGNPRPRIFRIPQAEALINRMGFSSKGIESFKHHLQMRKVPGIIGVNLGMNKSTELKNAHEDYSISMSSVYPLVDFVTINISSPNTPGLRELQDEKYLNHLLGRMKSKQQELMLKHNKKTSLLIKISPDLTEEELFELVSIALKNEIEGIIATNTTVDHSQVIKYQYGDEEGGLSGKPLFSSSTTMIKKIHEFSDGKIPIIGVGGILTPEDAKLKLEAGASLIQLYTGLIYHGPSLIKKIILNLS